jgi:glycosyltransferase involved in cell wall biosynthesis
MAAGTPVLASNLPGVRSVFCDGREGLLVKPGNIEDLKDKLKELLSDSDRLAAMAAAARTLTENKYSWPIISKQFDDIFKKFKNEEVL